jgi:SAM-dependent methyltransferase
MDAKRKVKLRMEVEDFVWNSPFLSFLLRNVPRKLRGSFKTRTTETIFSEVFQGNLWRDEESLSGPGSNLSETRAIRRDLPVLLRKYGIESILDVPCGDFNWMKEVDLAGVNYTGGDIVQGLIDANNEKYRSENRVFARVDLLTDAIPKADLVFVRDCLVHFSFTDAFRALKNICASGSGYLMTTTFPCRVRNQNNATGGWRPLNFQMDPFSFPEPLEIICEDQPLTKFADKSVGLWALRDISRCLPF